MSMQYAAILKVTRIDVYETLCLRGVGLEGQGGCVRRIEVFVKIQKKKLGGRSVGGSGGGVGLGGQGG